MELFKIFDTQDERREYAGSAFIEIQLCKMPVDTPIEKIVSVDAIEHWKNDSLYVVDLNMFYQQYRDVLAEGTYRLTVGIPEHVSCCNNSLQFAPSMNR